MTPDSDIPTVTVTVPATSVQNVSGAMTAVLLQGQHAFLQIFDDAQHTVFEIEMSPHGPVLHLHLRVAADEGESHLSMPPVDQARPPELTALIQHLQAVCARFGVALGAGLQ